MKYRQNIFYRPKSTKSEKIIPQGLDASATTTEAPVSAPVSKSDESVEVKLPEPNVTNYTYVHTDHFTSFHKYFSSTINYFYG